MGIDVNAIEQTVVVTAVGDEVNVNIIDQPVLVSVTDQIIEVEASGATGPQGPAGAGVAVGGTTGQVLSKASNTNYDTVWVDAGAGTVYSVNASGSTGISVTGGPITSTGTLTITNTLPDQIVGLTGAGTAVITGTYPNFTITTNDEFDGTVTSINLTAGTGISVSGGPVTGSGSINVVNTAPDQVVSLTGSGTTTITGTYPNFTITSNDSKVGTVTSVDMTVPTGLTISGNPITSAGTLALALASGYSIPTTANQANWTTAYNDSITSASVSGTSTKTLTLNQQDGGTIQASWSDIDTGLTSVGLSMPSAFAVSNSPLTSNGTLAVTGAGTSAQYVRGDGQLANFPTNGGGGSSVNYYLNGSVSQGTFGGDTYYEMSKTPILGAGTNFTRTNAQGNGYIASFITDAGDPSLLNIPGGNWNLEFYFQSSASGGSPQFYAELYKVDASNVFTLVASGSTNPEGITNGTTVDEYYTSIPVPQTLLLITDRLAIRIYVITSGRTITLHTENGNLCEVLTTFSTGLNALNGLTAQVQYFATGTSGTDFAISSATDTHTFNLPIASATNTGKLSNSDWNTFTNKQSAITLTTFNASGSATFVSSVLNIPTYTLVGLGGEPAITAGATTQYFRGDKTFQTLDTSVVPENSNLYYTDTRARNAITLTTTGSSGASTYSGGFLNIPIYSLSGLGGVPTTRTITINGTTQDLSADRTFTIPVHDAVTIGTANGLSLSTQVLSLGLASSSANGALSSTDWSTFNGKQNTITLTTTGTSGAATLVGATLNIPQYADQFVGTVTSVAALTLGTTGTDLSSTVANGTTTPVITLNVPTANATNRGALSSTDWTTFNNKQAALNGTGFVKISGTTISYDNSTYYLASNPSAYIALTALTASSPLSYNNTTGAFTIAQASGSLNGFLSSTDWTTFNNKQNTITNPVTGTGTTNYLPKWTSGTALGDSAVTDDGTTVTLLSRALSGSNATFKGGNAGNIKIDNDGSRYVQLLFERNTASNSGADFLLDGTNGTFGIRTLAAYPLTFSISGVAGTPVEQMRLTSTGLGIGTTSISEKLVVAGNIATDGNANRYIKSTGFISNQLGQLSDFGASDAGFYVLATGGLQFVGGGADRLRLTSNGNLGLGVVPSAWNDGFVGFEIKNSANNLSANGGSYFEISQNATWNSGWKYVNTAKASRYEQGLGEHFWFTAPSGTAGNAISFTQAMTLDASGNLMVGGTSVYGATITSYASATRSGGIGIRNSAGTFAGFFGTYAAGSGSGSTDILAESAGFMAFTSGGSERLRITSGGNVLVNTTSSGDAKLDIYNDSSNYAAFFRANTLYSGAYRIVRMYANGNPIMDIQSTNGTDLIFANNQNGFLAFNTNGSEKMRIKADGKINFSSLPTSATGLSAGDIWNDGGTLKIV
jgi:hypothetical protein